MIIEIGRSKRDMFPRRDDLRFQNLWKSCVFPRRDDLRFKNLWKSCDESRPLGIFHSSADQFLLCYESTLHSLTFMTRRSLPCRVGDIC
jgi:hypothetical protein